MVSLHIITVCFCVTVTHPFKIPPFIKIPLSYTKIVLFTTNAMCFTTKMLELISHSYCCYESIKVIIVKLDYSSLAPTCVRHCAQ